MKLLTAVLAATLALPALSQADEPMFSSQDLYNHLGIKGYKWNHDVAAPFNKVTINLIQYDRDEYGQLQKKVVYTRSTNNTSTWEAGTHPVTAMFDKQKCSLSFLTLNMSCADASDMMWADEEASYCSDYPMYLDGEYVFMVKWRDNQVSTNRNDMASYLCMTIETAFENQETASTGATRFH